MLRELVDIFWRGGRLRCPCCGHGRLFRSFAALHERCTGCDERFEREPGQWLGAVYLNLGLTLGLSGAGYIALQALTSIPPTGQATICTSIAAAGPFVFHRLSKGLWVSAIFLSEGLYLRWPSRAEALTSCGRTGRHPAPQQPDPVP